MTMLKTTLVLLLILAASSIAGAQNIAVTGSVRDASTGEPIVRATVRMLDGGRGTYTSREGKFRLPLPAGTHRIVVSSLGYESDTLSMTAGAGAVAVTLRPSTIELGEISVTAEMSAEDVVRSAIARKQENLARLETFSGLLYSKFALDIAGNAFGQIEDQDRATILETFSRYYYDRSERPPFQIEVVNRRQTANIPSEGNLFALGSFVSFYEDELPLLNARVMTPLAEDAFSRYRFELEGRTKLAGETVYIVKVIPTTTVLPAFTGTMKIVKGTFNLVEVDLKPTEATAIAFVRDIRFVQRFERFEGSIWYPTFLEITGEASVEIVRGFQQIDAKLRATSIVTEGSVNKPIPDSVFSPRDADGDRRMITAAADADSARSEFWENNALSELTPEEKETYERIDSLVAETDTMARQEERGISFGFLPGIDYNRVGGLTLLGNVNVGLGSLVDVGVSGGYSFGLERPIAEANLVLTPLATDDVSLSLNASAFTRLGTNHWDRSIPRIVNSVTTGLLHRDYYDWYRQDGWRAGLRAESGDLFLEGAFENSRHFWHPNSLRRSLLLKEPFRQNPLAMNGNMEVLSAAIGYGRTEEAIVISSGASADLGARISGMSGRERNTGRTFEGLEGKLHLELPTFGTGYVPMVLRVAAHAGAGIGSDSLPLQYQYRMRTAASIVAPFGHFMTAPIGRYGGTEYIALHAEHNFSDIVWRWLGLPTYWGRGVELIVSGASGRYRMSDRMWQGPFVRDYTPTGDSWYSEVGFGLGKIPTFISNVIFLRIDARFGVGDLARGNWGVGLSLSSPF